MFGFVIANREELTKEQMQRYQQIYCGICRRIRIQHSGLCRFALSYDLVFLALLLTSLVDCHFFNVGPVLFYSALLAFVEHQTYQRRLKQPKQ